MVVKFCPEEVVSCINMVIRPSYLAVYIRLQFMFNLCGHVVQRVFRQRADKSVMGIQKVHSNISSFSGSCFFSLPPLLLEKKNADQLWCFFASRNHRVYPICREEAVRLLRSTRMARAYSEGAYTSDYDYERYWHALPLHLCICHLLVSSSCPLSVFNLSVTIDVMTENDICLISVFVWVITALKWLLWYENTQLSLYVEAQSSVCCWWPAPDRFFIDVLVYVPMYIIPTVVCWSVLCVIISVFLFYTLLQPLIAHLYIFDALLWAVQ